MITAVFFDLDGTIRHNEPRGTDVFAQQAAKLGVRVRDDDLLRAMRWEHYYWARSREMLDDEQRYGRLTVEHWQRYSERQLVALGATREQAARLAIVVSQYMLNSYRPASVVPEDLHGVLETLKEARFKLGVISNRDKPFGDILSKLGMDSHFTFTLASAEVNAWKPDPQIFLQACSRIEVQPSEAVYVGDNYFADVVGAKRAGVMPVLYDPRGIFDDPECAVIRAFKELPRVLRLDGRA